MKTYLGIDIGSYNIKVVEVTKEGKEIKVLNAAISPTPPKAFLSEGDKDKEDLAKALKSLLSENKIKNKQANFSLWESQTFTRIIETPKLSDKELNQSLRWEAEQYIPLPLEEVNMDFVVLDRQENKEKMKVLLVASPLRSINKYIDVAELAGIEVKTLETEGLGIYRIFEKKNQNNLIINIGASNTNIYVLKKEALVLARSIGTGGNVLTKALLSELNLPLKQAEEYKRAYGLDNSQMESKIVNIFTPLINNLALEIEQSLAFFKERYQDEVITEIVLTGGSSFLPGLVNYFANKLHLKVIRGNPWKAFLVEEKIASQFSKVETVFSVATGLAVRDLI